MLTGYAESGFLSFQLLVDGWIMGRNPTINPETLNFAMFPVPDHNVDDFVGVCAFFITCVSERAKENLLFPNLGAVLMSECLGVMLPRPISYYPAQYGCNLSYVYF